MNVEVVAMIYRSEPFARFITDQLSRFCPVPWRLVGNDPTDDVTGYCTSVYHDPNPAAWYLSRVYRCWNHCVESSTADFVCLVNSDMAFSKGWLDALLSALDGKTLPVSRLVEQSVHLAPGEHAIPVDFGRDPEEFPHEGWAKFAKEQKEHKIELSGCYMPMLIDREAFLRVGGYPEGNVSVDSAGGVHLIDTRVPVRMKDGAWCTATGDFFMSGDAFFVHKMHEAGFQHVTVFDSVVYHMQEGEMRS